LYILFITLHFLLSLQELIKPLYKAMIKKYNRKVISTFFVVYSFIYACTNNKLSNAHNYSLLQHFYILWWIYYIKNIRLTNSKNYKYLV